MKPRIGITADIDKEHIKLKRDYVHAVTEAGGLPLILAPVSPYPGAGEKSQTSPLPSEERDRMRGYVEGIADAIDGLLLTGGDDIPPEYYGETLSIPSNILRPMERERVDFEISLFKEMMKRKKPILGICYGMQMVNVALGGTLYQDIETQVHNFLNHRQGEHEVRITQPLAFSPKFSAYVVNSSHHQAVKEPGKGLEVFTQANDGIIEGFYKKDYPFLVCVQCHPERGLERDGISLPLFKAFVEASKKR